MTKLLLIALILGSCIQQKNTTPQDAKTSNLLLGKWEWQKTTMHSRAGSSAITPSSCKCSKSITFLNNESFLHKSDSTIEEFIYTIDTLQLLNDPVRHIFKSELYQGDIAVHNDVLTISMANADGPSHHFIKVPK